MFIFRVGMHYVAGLRPDELIIDDFAGGGGGSTNILSSASAPRQRSAGGKRKHGFSYTPEYRAWQTMRLRCHNPSNQAFPDYGGRGITVCDRWRFSVENFMADMGPKPSPAHEIDRIDNDKEYSPENCRWVTRKENDRNRRSNRHVTLNGQTKTVAEWCELLGIRSDTMRWRLNKGWTIEQALLAPARPKKPNGSASKT